jgi:hypothetical protein
LTFVVGGIKKKIYESHMLLNHAYRCLGPVNINSGSTYPGIEISLWRYEEVYKVLIHELVHYYELDFNIFHPEYKKTEELSNKIFNLNGSDKMFEAYTETLANIIHCCLIEYYTGIAFEKLIWLETSFTLFQIAKIINYFGFNSAFEILKKNQNEKNKKKINQTTSVLSYFIIKGSFLFNINKYIKFVGNNIRMKNKLNTFLNLVEICTTDNTYLESIDKYIDYLTNTENIDEYIKNTMRMTCIQIDI